MRAWSERQIDRLRTEFEQACDQVSAQTAQLAQQARDGAAAQVAALEEARGELRAFANRAQVEAASLRAERDRLAAHHQGVATPAARKPRNAAGPPTKRDRMIALAVGRTDLAALPLKEVSGVANELAAEIGYSPGTARRELLAHVRHLQSAGNGGAPANGETTEGVTGNA
jgi:hypothetical protein